MLYLPSVRDIGQIHMSLTAKLMVFGILFAQDCGCQDVSDRLYQAYIRNEW